MSKEKITKRDIKHNIEDLDLPEKDKLRAIAIRYDVKKDKAPKILATGRGRVAEKILQVAEENKVPFYEDKALTDLLAKLEIESDIPPQLYSLVAEVLAFVYQLDKLAKKKSNSVKIKFNK